MSSPFDVINSINSGKEVKDESAFNPWITNRFYSFFPDTLFYAQMMNLNYGLEPKYQLSFYINTVRPSRRWQKWLKNEESEDYKAIQEWYGYNDQKTKQALSVLTKEQIDVIRKKIKKE